MTALADAIAEEHRLVAEALERLHRTVTTALGHDIDRRVVAIVSGLWATGAYSTAADRFRDLADDLDVLQRRVDLARGVPVERRLHVVQVAS